VEGRGLSGREVEERELSGREGGEIQEET